MNCYFLNLFLILFLVIIPIAGQEQSTTNVGNSPNFNQQKSLLIKEILQETSQLKSEENQIFVYTLMIDYLWENDEETARQLALTNAKTLGSKLVLNKDIGEMIRYFPYNYEKLRSEFIVTLAKYDFSFALKMKAQTIPSVLSLKSTDESQQNTLQYLITKERDLEQKMAFQLAAKDLKSANKFANESLDQGISHMSLNTLRRFQIKDIDVANAFADKVIDRLLKSDFKNNRTAEGTISNLISQMDEKLGTFGRILKCDNSIYCTKPLTIDQNRFRNLAAKWLDHTLTSPNEKISFYFLNTMPMLIKALPERKLAISNKFESIKKSQPKTVEYKQIQEKSFDEKTSPNEIAQFAINKSEQERFTYYNLAFRKAANSSKEALENLLLAVFKHPDSEEKNWLIDRINSHIAGRTADEGDLDKALEIAQKIVNKDMRTGLLTYISRKYFEKGEMGKAIIITDEITSLLDLNHKDKLPKSIISYDKFSNIFILFTLVNPERAFLLLETVLPDSNEYFANNFGKLNDGEINLRELVSRNTWGFMSYSTPIKRLVETDFEQTKKLIRYFESPELSVIAKVLVLKSISDKEFVFNNSEDIKEMVYRSN